jgi:hypothetical protein
MKGVGVRVFEATSYREMRYRIFIAVDSLCDAYVVSYFCGIFSAVCPCCMLQYHREDIAEILFKLQLSGQIRSIKWASPYLTDPGGSTAYGEVVGGFEEFANRRIVCEPILVESIPSHVLDAVRYA